LARWLDGESTLTITGQVLGSPNFMPPEQASADRGKVGRPSDVYGLGAILYYLLTARGPFQAESIEGIVTQVLHAEPVSPRLLVPCLPRDLETICLKCLQKEPQKRYSTAQELADELGRILRGEPILARPISPVEKTWRWCRRKPALASFVAATSLLFLAILIGSPIAAYRINQARKAEANETLRARRNEYAAQMLQAQYAIAENYLDRASELLEKHRPKSKSEIDLRGWEWGYPRKQMEGDQLAMLATNFPAGCVAYSPDGRILAAGHTNGLVRIWDPVTRQKSADIPGTNRPAGITFSPDSQLIAVGYRDSLVRFREVSSQHEVFTLKTKAIPSSVRFSPNGRYFAAGSWEGATVEVWDLTTRSNIAALPLARLNKFTVALCFTPDSQMLIYNRGDHSIVLWDLARRAEKRSFRAHTALVEAMSLSRDGRRLFSSSTDGTLKLWDLETSALAAEFPSEHPFILICFQDECNCVIVCGWQDLSKLI
jgi:hypothetical protein